MSEDGDRVVGEEQGHEQLSGYQLEQRRRRDELVMPMAYFRGLAELGVFGEIKAEAANGVAMNFGRLAMPDGESNNWYPVEPLTEEVAMVLRKEKDDGDNRELTRLHVEAFLSEIKDTLGDRGGMEVKKDSQQYAGDDVSIYNGRREVKFRSQFGRMRPLFDRESEEVKVVTGPMTEVNVEATDSPEARRQKAHQWAVALREFMFKLDPSADGLYRFPGQSLDANYRENNGRAKMTSITLRK